MMKYNRLVISYFITISLLFSAGSSLLIDTNDLRHHNGVYNQLHLSRSDSGLFNELSFDLSPFISISQHNLVQNASSRNTISGDKPLGQNGSPSFMPPQPGKFPEGEPIYDGSIKNPIDTQIEMILNSNDSTLSFAPSFAAPHPPSPGSIERVLVIPIEFQDEKFDIGKNSAYFQVILDQMKDYYEKNSEYSINQKGMSLVATIASPVLSEHEVLDYSSDFNNIDNLAAEAVNKLETADFDFSVFDKDNDDVIDHLIIIHAGRGGEETNGALGDIWSHFWSINHSTVVVDGKTALYYSCVPETGTVGVYAHEFGHDLGLPDLYDTNGYTEGVGSWDIMGSGSWNTANGLPAGSVPSNFSAWSRIKLGWATSTTVTSDGIRTLTNSTGNSNILRMWTDGAVGVNEYWLAEYRRKLDYDAGLPGEGVLIWHIDENWITSHTRSVNETSSEATKLTDRQGVELEQADGLYSLRENSRGDSGDPYPGLTGNTSFSAVPYPLNISNIISSVFPYVDVGNISLSGDTASMDISVMKTKPNTAPPLITPSDNAWVTSRPELKWGYAPKAQSYVLQWSTDPSFLSAVTTLELSNMSQGLTYVNGVYGYTLTEGQAFTNYDTRYWRVAAINALSTAQNYVFSATPHTMRLDLAEDVTFSLIGANTNQLVSSTTAMEYSLDGGTVWIPIPTESYTLTNDDLGLLTATNDLKIRMKAADPLPAGPVKVFDILAIPEAPAVTFTMAGDDSYILLGSTTAMEFSIDGEASWVKATIDNELTSEQKDQLSADYNIQIRYISTPLHLGESNIQTIDLIEGPEAPSVSFSMIDPNANMLQGSTTDMEFSMDGGSSWMQVASDNMVFTTGQIAQFTANSDLQIRIAAIGLTFSGIIQTIDLSAGPSAPSVTANDTTNTISGIDTTMEFSTNGTTWSPYINTSSIPNLTGTVTIRIRVMASGLTLPSSATVLNFTATVIPPPPPPAPDPIIVPPALPPPPVIAPPVLPEPIVPVETLPTAGEILDELTLATSLSNQMIQSISLSVPANATEPSLAIPQELMKSILESGKSLAINTGTALLSFDPAIFQTGMGLTSDPSKEVFFKLSVEQALPSGLQENNTALNSPVSGALRPVGKLMFSFSASWHSGDEKADVKVFKTPITVQIPIHSADLVGLNPEKIGVYWWNSTLKSWDYIGGLYNPNTRSISFQTLHFSDFAVMQANPTFSDITRHWAKSGIEVMASKQIAKGTGGTLFSPEKSISRAEFIALLTRSIDLIPNLADTKLTNAGIPPSALVSSIFKDVKDNKWYAKELRTALVKGLIKPVDGSLFRPDEPITREEMAIYMDRAIKIKEKAMNTVTTTLTDEKVLDVFADQNTISFGVRQAMANVVAKKLIGGKAVVVNGKKSTILAPLNGASRAEALTVLYRLFNLLQ